MLFTANYNYKPVLRHIESIVWYLSCGLKFSANLFIAMNAFLQPILLWKPCVVVSHCSAMVVPRVRCAPSHVPLSAVGRREFRFCISRIFYPADDHHIPVRERPCHIWRRGTMHCRRRRRPTPCIIGLSSPLWTSRVLCALEDIFFWRTYLGRLKFECLGYVFINNVLHLLLNIFRYDTIWDGKCDLVKL